jgi:DnaK suppressor protein
MRTRQRLEAEQLTELRTMLEEQREFRLDQLTALRRPNSRSLLGGKHREIAVALTVGAETALGEVLAALRRMDDGSYGSCERCNGPIDLERLEVLPQTALCLTCQSGTP